MHYVATCMCASVVLVTMNAASIAAPHIEAHHAQDRHFRRHREASPRSEG